MRTDPLAQSIQTLASGCVKCGLCLPHCPTYAVSANECESPRGRIALLDAIAREQLPITTKTQQYLDHCLTCRACEAVCPANVEYGALIDQGRELLRQKTTEPPSPTRAVRLINFMLARRLPGYGLARLLALYQRTGLQWLARKSGLLKLLNLTRADAVLSPPLTLARWRALQPARGVARGQVALFTGCINQLVDRATIQAAIQVLNACGYSVHIPTAQGCCGALAQHAGLTVAAMQFAQHNLSVFARLPVTQIITLTTGCAATLQALQSASDPERAAAFARKIIDINQFLITHPGLETIALRPLAARAVLHTPCTLRNVLKTPTAPAQLLAKIKDLSVLELPTTTFCCGAAGYAMLEHPQLADTLREKVLEYSVPLKPEYLLSTNLGCALHLQSGLSARGLNVQVMHPIRLIAQQLITAPRH